MRRQAIGGLVLIARLMGLGLIALGVLSLPQVRAVTGHLADKIGVVAALTLGIVGIVWLLVVQIFLRFFDQFLSRQ